MMTLIYFHLKRPNEKKKRGQMVNTDFSSLGVSLLQSGSRPTQITTQVLFADGNVLFSPLR